MLTSLTIQGLAVIEFLRMEFSANFNIITGETGAGKSILIKALSFLFGAKLDGEAVRKNHRDAIVVGGFCIPLTHGAFAILDQLGIQCETDGDHNARVLIRRQINRKGRSRAWINDIQVTLGTLGEIATTLIDIIGQNKNQELLDHNKHSYYLDSFLDSLKTKEEVLKRYRDYLQKYQYIINLAENYNLKSKDFDYLSYRFQELESFNPSLTDYHEVLELSQRTVGKFLLRERVAKAQSLIGEGQLPGLSIGQRFTEIAIALSLDDNQSDEERRCGELAQKAEEVAHVFDEISYGLEILQTKLCDDTADGELAQERLKGYQDLYRKFAVANVEGLIARRQKLKEELDFLTDAKSLIEEHVVELKGLMQGLQAAFQRLFAARKSAALKVKRMIERELTQLNMKGAIFEVGFCNVKNSLAKELPFSGLSEEFKKTWAEASKLLEQSSKEGKERAQFFFSANPPEPPKPLVKVVSGGELSRIMLALKKVLAKESRIPSLVFDEIDVGISGGTADIIGKKIKELSRDYQIVCISHLPQIAAYGDNHLLVKKSMVNDTTQSQIVRLSRVQSAKEIARLLSGGEVTSQGMENAKALLKKAKGGAAIKVDG